jgi:hypothetical protein
MLTDAQEDNTNCTHGTGKKVVEERMYIFSVALYFKYMNVLTI